MANNDDVFLFATCRSHRSTVKRSRSVVQVSAPRSYRCTRKSGQHWILGENKTEEAAPLHRLADLGAQCGRQHEHRSTRLIDRTWSAKMAGLCERDSAATRLHAWSGFGSTKRSCRAKTTALIERTGLQSLPRIGVTTAPLRGSMFGCHVLVSAVTCGAGGNDRKKIGCEAR